MYMVPARRGYQLTVVSCSFCAVALITTSIPPSFPVPFALQLFTMDRVNGTDGRILSL